MPPLVQSPKSCDSVDGGVMLATEIEQTSSCEEVLLRNGARGEDQEGISRL